MNEITFRRATLEDISILYNLSVEFERYNKDNSTRPHEHFLGDWEKYFTEEIETSIKRRFSYVYIAFVNGVPAGYVFARLCKDCYAFIIEELFVKSDFSKLGIGAKLLDLVIKHGKKLGYDIKVEVFDWNQVARDYYIKRGFFVESLVLKLTL